MPILPSATSPLRLYPSDATLAARSSARSSKLMNTPGSLNLTTPFTRKVAPNRVLPLPAAPQISVGRPVGKPPKVMASKPEMPVGVFGSKVRLDTSSGIDYPYLIRIFLIAPGACFDCTGRLFRMHFSDCNMPVSATSTSIVRNLSPFVPDPLYGHSIEGRR